MLYKRLVNRLFGSGGRRNGTSEFTETPLDKLPEYTISPPVKEINEIDPESIRLENWLKDNFHEPLRDTKREIVIRTGTDFLTNQPILDLTPRIEYTEPKRKHQYGNSTVNAENFSTRVTDGGGIKVSYLFQKNSDWVRCLLEDGELYIDSHDHNGKQSTGLRGSDLAKRIASSLKQYLRNELGIMNPDVRVVPASGRDARITMSAETHRRYKEKIYAIYATSQYATV